MPKYRVSVIVNEIAQVYIRSTGSIDLEADSIDAAIAHLEDLDANQGIEDFIMFTDVSRDEENRERAEENSLELDEVEILPGDATIKMIVPHRDDEENPQPEF